VAAELRRGPNAAASATPAVSARYCRPWSRNDRLLDPPRPGAKPQTVLGTPLATVPTWVPGRPVRAG